MRAIHIVQKVLHACLVCGPIACLALCLVDLPLPAAEVMLSIRLVEPDLPTRLIVGPQWKIYLDGVIDDAAVGRLGRAIKAQNVKFATVFLNSPGGSLLGGIRLGHLIRELGFSTYVGKAAISGDHEEPAKCYSACVLAFVGGYFRSLTSGSTIGVHRFSKTRTSPADLDIAQEVSATIIAYLAEMGVDVALFELMSRAGKDEIRIVPDILAKRYRVVNNGFQPPSWSIEALEQGLYLRGVQEAWYGTGKALFTCAKGGQIIFQAMYKVGEKAQEIVMGSVRHSFRVGDAFLPLENPLHPLREANGYVVASFVLPKEYILFLFKAEAVGYAAHPPNPNFFWGFKVEIGDARGKIDAFVKACKARP
jgi:hypothetical protein